MNTNTDPEQGNTAEADHRIPEYTDAVERIGHGEFAVTLKVEPLDEVGQLGLALSHLAENIEHRYLEVDKLATITGHINAGLLLDEVLDHVFDEFKDMIPYNRIGFSLIEPSTSGPLVRARWARTDLPVVTLKKGYAAPLSGSSLETIIATGQPRIINDLAEYGRKKPQSQSTQLILQEGIRSSLTCPLVTNGGPVGFMFFSSVTPGIYQDAHIALFKSIAGQLSVIVEKGRLVSNIIAQQEAIDRQNQDLRTLNDMKTTFVGIAAHDLRNPLSNIRMSIELLRMSDEEIPPATKQEILDQMQNQTSFMLSLLNDLLDVTQIDSGKIKIDRTDVDVAATIDAAIARQNQLAAAKWTTVLDDGVSAGSAYADPTRLQQVLDNLISNAVKYSPPGSTVRVRAAHEHGLWRFSVEDQGPGITAEDRKRLFQDFAKLSAQPTGGEKATGLGLSITRRIVEAHGGKIGVDSEPGHGATFWFTLPDQVESPATASPSPEY
jgi:signal transduction histidine kinase